ncbi:MAG: ATP-dependent zinc metalloprotease FtsH [Bacteroidota bacterium]
MYKEGKNKSGKFDHQEKKGEGGAYKRSNPQKKKKFSVYWIYAIIALVFFGIQFLNWGSSIKDTTWQEFEREMLNKYEVERIVVVNNEIVEIYIKKDFLPDEKYNEVSQKAIGGSPNPGPHYFFTIGSPEIFVKKLDEAQAEFAEEDIIEPVYEKRKNWGGELLGWLFPIILMIALWIFIMRRMSGGVGGGPGNIFNIGKSRAALIDSTDEINISFKDVASLEEAKEEIQEIVEFLKKPQKYTKLGAKIPKGVLLIGPPGTGKTLLAKAVAGEAGVPFFSLTGSDFVEMFVGVGAARVRDLFKQAKAKAPSIIFIDEIDAVGRTRSRAQFTGANDERENTLNSLLSEMDGFSTNSGVIILAATNRPEILDSALLRGGRFDRQIAIDRPDIKGREAIFEVHLKPIKFNKDVSAKTLATQTPGFAGADIANVCNEAALIAARNNSKVVGMKDFQDAIDRVIGGLEKKSKIISPEEKEIIAYHEAGHAVAGWFLEHANPLVKVSIVPRGLAALGYAQYLPKEQYLYRTEKLIDEMCMTLGGRVAEEIIFGKITTGALDDLERVTKVAYSMVTMYGMNEKIGNISFYDPQQGEYSFTKPYSETTGQTIDEEVRNIVQDAYERTKKLLLKKRKELELISKELLKKEVIFKDDLVRLIGKRPFGEKDTEEKSVKGTNELPVLEHAEKTSKKVKEKTIESKTDETTLNKHALKDMTQYIGTDKKTAKQTAEENKENEEEQPNLDKPEP